MKIYNVELDSWDITLIIIAAVLAVSISYAIAVAWFI